MVGELTLNACFHSTCFLIFAATVISGGSTGPQVIGFQTQCFQALVGPPERPHRDTAGIDDLIADVS